MHHPRADRTGCLNHPKALLISATEIQQIMGAQGGGVSITRRLCLSLQLGAGVGSCTTRDRCLNHPKALLISATPAFRIVGRSRTSIPVSITRRLCLSLQL